jgi:hypothetical protein
MGAKLRRGALLNHSHQLYGMRAQRVQVAFAFIEHPIQIFMGIRNVLMANPATGCG